MKLSAVDIPSVTHRVLARLAEQGCDCDPNVSAELRMPGGDAASVIGYALTRLLVFHEPGCASGQAITELGG